MDVHQVIPRLPQAGRRTLAGRRDQYPKRRPRAEQQEGGRDHDSYGGSYARHNMAQRAHLVTQDVVTVSADRILDHDTVDYVYALLLSTTGNVSLTPHHISLRSGYSRIPVHKPGHPLAFVGLLLVKQVRMRDQLRAEPHTLMLIVAFRLRPINSHSSVRVPALAPA